MQARKNALGISPVTSSARKTQHEQKYSPYGIPHRPTLPTVVSPHRVGGNWRGVTIRTSEIVI